MLPLLGIALVIVLLDQATKLLVRMHMMPGDSIPLIPKIFHLTYVQNPGAAFGMFAHQTAFFIIIAVAVILFILVFFHKTDRHQKLLRIGLSLQLGGAVGNLIDRIYLGHVTDFFDFRIWPVFNIADMAIVFGVVLLCWEIIKASPEGEKSEIR